MARDGFDAGAVPKRQIRRRRILAYCGRIMVLTMGSTSPISKSPTSSSDRNGKGRLRCRGRPKTTNQTPPDISLLRANNGLDNGVHFTHFEIANFIVRSEWQGTASMPGPSQNDKSDAAGY